MIAFNNVMSIKLHYDLLFLRPMQIKVSIHTLYTNIYMMTQKTQVHASRPKWVVKKLNAASLYLDDRVQRIQFRKKIVVFFAETYKSLCFASFAYCVCLSLFCVQRGVHVCIHMLLLQTT